MAVVPPNVNYNFCCLRLVWCSRHNMVTGHSCNHLIILNLDESGPNGGTFIISNSNLGGTFICGGSVQLYIDFMKNTISPDGSRKESRSW